MMNDIGSISNDVVRLFERLAGWLGLGANTAPTLAVLFFEKYRTGRMLSSEELSRRTGYSRAGTGMVLAELLDAGVVYRQKDPDQTGRGRKRILYAVNGDFATLFVLGIKRMTESLRSMRDQITELLNSSPNEGGLLRMLRDLHRRVCEGIECLERLPKLPPDN